MKTRLIYLLAAWISFSFYSCTDEYNWKHKSDFNPDEEIATTTYQEGKKYTRCFYYYQASMEDALLSATFPFPTKALISECGRIRLGITENKDLQPSALLQYNLVNVNETFTNDDGLSFWLVAEFSFVYKEFPEGQTYYTDSEEELEALDWKQETDWKILEGYMLPYTWDDRTYDQLVYE